MKKIPSGKSKPKKKQKVKDYSRAGQIAAWDSLVTVAHSQVVFWLTLKVKGTAHKLAQEQAAYWLRVGSAAMESVESLEKKK